MQNEHARKITIILNRSGFYAKISELQFGELNVPRSIDILSLKPLTELSCRKITVINRMELLPFFDFSRF